MLRKSAVALLYSVVLSIFIATLSFAAEAVPVKVVSVTDGDKYAQRSTAGHPPSSSIFVDTYFFKGIGRD